MLNTPLTIRGNVEDLIAENMNNGHNVMSVATGDACLPLLLYLCAGHVVKILGT
jgi:hypothetical protein